MSYNVRISVQIIKQIRNENPGIGLLPAVLIPKSWCEENCNGEWEKLEHLKYCFEDEIDAMAFKLRWT